MSVLNTIVDDVRAALPARRALMDVDALRQRAATRPRNRANVVQSLRRDGSVRVIAEVKRNSPAKGALAAITDPAALAADYAAGGAAAISVLTEPKHFGGSLDDLAAVRSQVEVPLLRKDFIVDPYQLAEAAAHGADLVLLIVAALGQEDLSALLAAAHELDLAVLVETHTADEVRRAADVGAEIIGINARDLNTLEVDRAVFGKLVQQIPDGVVAVAESGVRGPDDVRIYADAGADGVLVGSSLVTSGNPREAVAALVEALP